MNDSKRRGRTTISPEKAVFFGKEYEYEFLPEHPDLELVARANAFTVAKDAQVLAKVLAQSNLAPHITRIGNGPVLERHFALPESVYSIFLDFRKEAGPSALPAKDSYFAGDCPNKDFLERHVAHYSIEALMYETSELVRALENSQDLVSCFEESLYLDWDDLLATMVSVTRILKPQGDFLIDFYIDGEEWKKRGAESERYMGVFLSSSYGAVREEVHQLLKKVNERLRPMGCKLTTVRGEAIRDPKSYTKVYAVRYRLRKAVYSTIEELMREKVEDDWTQEIKGALTAVKPSDVATTVVSI